VLPKQKQQGQLVKLQMLVLIDPKTEINFPTQVQVVILIKCFVTNTKKVLHRLFVFLVVKKICFFESNDNTRNKLIGICYYILHSFYCLQPNASTSCVAIIESGIPNATLCS
jgi:hypothetical protein